MLSNYTVSSGYVTVQSDGAVSNITICSNGGLYVSGGTATGIIASSGARLGFVVALLEFVLRHNSVSKMVRCGFHRKP